MEAETDSRLESIGEIIERIVAGLGSAPTIAANDESIAILARTTLPGPGLPMPRENETALARDAVREDDLVRAGLAPLELSRTRIEDASMLAACDAPDDTFTFTASDCVVPFSMITGAPDTTQPERPSRSHGSRGILGSALPR